jgi:hypothetical protein
LSGLPPKPNLPLQPLYNTGSGKVNISPILPYFITLFRLSSCFDDTEYAVALHGRGEALIVQQAGRPAAVAAYPAVDQMGLRMNGRQMEI